MSITQETANVSEANESDDGPGLLHYVCDVCNKNIALCGQDVTHDPWDISNDNLDPMEVCIVCDHLASLPCENCGDNS